MADRRTFLLAIILTVVGGITAVIATTAYDNSVDRWITVGIQQALDALRSGDNQTAEQIAKNVIRIGGVDSWRAWLIVACVQHRSQRYEQASKSYRRFLASCRNPFERKYVVEQIRKCHQLTRKSGRGEISISGKIPPERLKKLSLFTGRQYIESSEHFVVRAYNPDLAKLTAKHAEAALDRICKIILLGQDYPHSVDVYIWPTITDYRTRVARQVEFSQGSFSLTKNEAGKTVRRIDLVQLNSEGRFDLALLEKVLPHELCHLVFSEFLGDAPCPLAINEGLAMLAQARVDESRLRLAGAAIAAGKAIPLEDLLTIRKYQQDYRSLFYAESFSLVEYLHRNLSPKQFHEVLVNIKDGCCLAEAIQRALYVPPDENFLKSLSIAWQNDAIKQWQFLKALDG